MRGLAALSPLMRGCVVRTLRWQSLVQPAIESQVGWWPSAKPSLYNFTSQRHFPDFTSQRPFNTV